MFKTLSREDLIDLASNPKKMERTELYELLAEIARRYKILCECMDRF